MYDKVKFLIASDTSICVEFGNEISKEINAKIRAFEDTLKDHPIEGIEETVPTYRSVLVHYNPGIVTFAELAEKLSEIIEKSGNVEASEGELVRVPVCYGGEYGPDLEYVAEYHNMTAEEVISIHTGAECLIYMLGFTPGFSYMGGMDPRIATPRLKTPRVKIPAGSVGIAAGQTGIYPIDSPGGWQLIGRTPWKLYDPHREPAVLFEAGQRVQFYAITEEEFKRMEAEQA